MKNSAFKRGFWLKQNSNLSLKTFQHNLMHIFYPLTKLIIILNCKLHWWNT